jgi:hypothetical protein
MLPFRNLLQRIIYSAKLFSASYDRSFFEPTQDAFTPQDARYSPDRMSCSIIGVGLLNRRLRVLGLRVFANEA